MVIPACSSSTIRDQPHTANAYIWYDTSTLHMPLAQFIRQRKASDPQSEFGILRCLVTLSYVYNTAPGVTRATHSRRGCRISLWGIEGLCCLVMLML